jgi:hypothetical protein
MMDKEYNIKLNIEFTGIAIGANRQEAIEDLDILDFIDEAAHSGCFKIKDTEAKLKIMSMIKSLTA